MSALRWMMVLVVAGAAWSAVPPSYGAAPPLNDNYLFQALIPQSMTTGTQQVNYAVAEDTTAATTQSDLFNPEPHGLPFAGGGRERLSCDGVSFGNTVWFLMQPKINEVAQLQASGYPNAIAVYQVSKKNSKIIRLTACSGSTSTRPNQLTLPFELQGGKLYTVQVGGLQTGTTIASGTLNFNATFYPDRDGDKSLGPLDNCPSLPGVPRFGGCPPTILPLPDYRYVGASASAIRFTRFAVKFIPAGARVQVKCSCRRSQVVTSGPHADSVAVPALTGATVPFGSTIQIWTTKRATHRGLYEFGAIGAYRRYTVGSGGLTVATRACLMPGSMQPRRTCPPG